MKFFRGAPPSLPVDVVPPVKLPVYISVHARIYIAELMAAPAGSVERMIGDTVDLLGDEYLFAATAVIKKNYAEGSEQYTIAAEISRLAVRK